MRVDAVDLSNYTTNVPGFEAPGGVITAGHVSCWLSKDCKKAIIGTQWPILAQHQLDTCLRGGMQIDAYHWVWYDQNYIGQVRASIQAVKNFPIGIFWVDLEDNRTPKSQAEIIRISHEVIAEAERQLIGTGIQVGIYTAAWWWIPHTNNYTGFSNYPLWNAYYYQAAEGGLPFHVPVDAHDFKPYGGWVVDDVYLWQYAGSVPLCGANVDYNIDFVPINGPVTPIEEDEDMYSHLAWSTWFPGRQYGPTPAGTYEEMNVMGDFQLPAGTKAVLMSVKETGVTRSVWYHGKTDFPAVAIEDSRGRKTYIINLSEDGKCRFRNRVGTTFEYVQCVGRYN